MEDIKQSLLAQLDAVLRLYESQQERVTVEHVGSFTSAAIAAIERVAGPSSAYAKRAHDKLDGVFGPGHHRHLPYLAGIVRTLRNDLACGHVASLPELVHGQVFGDFLEMADYLLNEGYKDAAAVIGGGVLEVHLRNLCSKHGVEVETTSNAEAKPKKAERLNSDLAGAGAYSKLDQKNVTAWLDLRNKAAHAKYAEYTKDQVALMIQAIRDFITRNPA